jgi:hypothetical protein
MAKKKKQPKAAKSELDSFSAAPEALSLEADAGQVGQTSAEAAGKQKADEHKLAFGLWDLTALLSLVCITLATGLLFLELQSFGNLLQGSWPWSVSTAKISAAPAPTFE